MGALVDDKQHYETPQSSKKNNTPWYYRSANIVHVLYMRMPRSEDAKMHFKCATEFEFRKFFELTIKNHGSFAISIHRVTNERVEYVT